MRVFLTREAVRLVRKLSIGADELRDAIVRAERGSIDADLGGGVIKQRVGRGGMGRSRAARAIIVLWSGELAVFVHVFAKSDKSNLSALELAAFKDFAKLVRRIGPDVLAGRTAWTELEDDHRVEDTSH
ncbi:MAG TPA: type II toxin-antitoxin system RelE/ParE family toxin [Beijerinckiaceae bacterium]|jgi:hypothetical protein